MRRKSKNLNKWVNLTLVICTSISVIALLVVGAISIYLSIGGSDRETARQGFYTAEAATTQVEAPAEEATPSQPVEDNSATGETITVQAGEGEASIAARAGISIAELERLNPSHMTTGSWYANPGDVVNIQ